MNTSRNKEQRLTLLQRIVSASAGAIATSLLVTPLDVVKTRLQAQAQLDCPNSPKSAAQCAKCAFINFNNGLMDHKLPRDVVCTHAKYQLNGTLDGLYKISRYEGVGALYNGLPPTLLMAVPATVLYFATYDKLKLYYEDQGYGLLSSSLLSGSIARITAVTVVSPLELLRTKNFASVEQGGMLQTLSSYVKANGVRALWRGLTPTIIRDVPFSAIYWVSVEAGKAKLRERYPTISEVEASFVSGAFGGSIAALVTIPFDVVKTRKQVFDYSSASQQTQMNTRMIIRKIIREEGYQGLITGIGPRLLKVSPACAIMLSSYELGKQFFLDNDLIAKNPNY
mmetsp:Transcript_16523/g.18675  ORF Transcript_16523/g.18675 Transcript_16523/m.18675 type:complete len:339 (+) Transcript_16523:307-1323(+)